MARKYWSEMDVEFVTKCGIIYGECMLFSKHLPVLLWNDSDRLQIACKREKQDIFLRISLFSNIRKRLI